MYVRIWWVVIFSLYASLARRAMANCQPAFYIMGFRNCLKPCPICIRILHRLLSRNLEETHESRALIRDYMEEADRPMYQQVVEATEIGRRAKLEYLQLISEELLPRLQ